MRKITFAKSIAQIQLTQNINACICLLTVVLNETSVLITAKSL